MTAHSYIRVGAAQCIQARETGRNYLCRDFQYGLLSGLRRSVERAGHPGAQLVHPFRHVDGDHARDAWTVRGPVPVGFVTPTVLFRDTSATSPTGSLMVPGSSVGLS